MNNLIKCELCDVKFSHQSGFSYHLNKTHNLCKYEYAKEYYDITGKESNSYVINHKSRRLEYKANKDYTCLICDMPLTNKFENIASHVKRIHKIDPIDYVKDNYILVGDCLDEECGLCLKRTGVFSKMYEVNHTNKTYTAKEHPTFSCGNSACKEESSIEFLGTSYNKKTFEFIGAKSEYLARIYKKDISFIKDNLKRGERDPNKPSSTSLSDYIEREGLEKGTISYNKRCEKIKYSMTIDYYLEKYGETKGKELYRARIDNFTASAFGKNRSKVQAQFNEIVLSGILNKIEDEFPFDETDIRQRADFHAPEHNLIIEFFGDYWHANPDTVSKGDIHKTIKVPVEDIWKKDRDRVYKLNELGYNVIIVWESSYRKAIADNSINELQSIILGYINDEHRAGFIEI